MKDEIRKLIKDWFHSKVGINLIAAPSLDSLVDEIQALRIHNVVGRSEQLLCDCCEDNLVEEDGDWCNDCLENPSRVITK